MNARVALFALWVNMDANYNKMNDYNNKWFSCIMGNTNTNSHNYDMIIMIIMTMNILVYNYYNIIDNLRFNSHTCMFNNNVSLLKSSAIYE